MRTHQVENFSGLNILVCSKQGPYRKASDDAWEIMLAFATNNHINRARKHYYSIPYDNPQTTPAEQIRYDACLQAPLGIREQGEVKHKMVSGGNYITFTYQSTASYKFEIFEKIHSEWIPEFKDSYDSSRLSFCEHHNLEFALLGGSILISKVYIPTFSEVVKKSISF